jgi:hypothetical protein
MGLFCGALLFLGGVCLIVFLIFAWIKNHVSSSPELVAVGATLIVVGTNVIFSSLLTSAMSISPRAPKADASKEEQERRKLW